MRTLIKMYGGLVVVVVAVVAAVVLGVVVCGWADAHTEEQTTEAAAIEWCAVCCDYADTHIGIGGVVVCGVCDTILSW